MSKSIDYFKTTGGTGGLERSTIYTRHLNESRCLRYKFYENGLRGLKYYTKICIHEDGCQNMIRH